MKLTEEQINFCMECGVCTGSCPVSRLLPSFSPRQMIKRTLMDQDDAVLLGRELWACLTCARCSVRCPVQIDFPEFARAHRELARKSGNMPRLSHHGTLQSITELQTRVPRQNRTQWAREVGKFTEKGEIFFFVGCAPYFDAALPFGAGALETAGSILQLLNRMGIEPVLSDQERCCGHDAVWSGDEKTFKKLAEANLRTISESGARTVVFGCPEGYMTFRDHVPEHFGELPFEVLHVTEFLARELPRAGLKFRAASNGDRLVTYQDPCRLGRKAGIYDAPRELIELVPGVRFREMERSRENALCCGTSAWIECSSFSKSMQMERLQEARESGAETLITSCSKCRIHLTCAQSDTETPFNVGDLYTFLLDHTE